MTLVKFYGCLLVATLFCYVDAQITILNKTHGTIICTVYYAGGSLPCVPKAYTIAQDQSVAIQGVLKDCKVQIMEIHSNLLNQTQSFGIQGMTDATIEILVNPQGNLDIHQQ